jgi:hypothetical protein
VLVLISMLIVTSFSAYWFSYEDKDYYIRFVTFAFCRIHRPSLCSKLQNNKQFWYSNDLNFAVSIPFFLHFISFGAFLLHFAFWAVL